MSSSVVHISHWYGLQYKPGSPFSTVLRQSRGSGYYLYALSIRLVF